jgi:hypothetical protein
MRFNVFNRCLFTDSYNLYKDLDKFKSDNLEEVLELLNTSYQQVSLCVEKFQNEYLSFTDYYFNYSISVAILLIDKVRCIHNLYWEIRKKNDAIDGYTLNTWPFERGGIALTEEMLEEITQKMFHYCKQHNLLIENYNGDYPFYFKEEKSGTPTYRKKRLIEFSTDLLFLKDEIRETTERRNNGLHL